jgi:hypothetical protein
MATDQMLWRVQTGATYRFASAERHCPFCRRERKEQPAETCCPTHLWANKNWLRGSFAMMEQPLMLRPLKNRYRKPLE